MTSCDVSRQTCRLARTSAAPSWLAPDRFSFESAAGADNAFAWYQFRDVRSSRALRAAISRASCSFAYFRKA